MIGILRSWHSVAANDPVELLVRLLLSLGKDTHGQNTTDQAAARSIDPATNQPTCDVSNLVIGNPNLLLLLEKEFVRRCLCRNLGRLPGKSVEIFPR